MFPDVDLQGTLYEELSHLDLRRDGGRLCHYLSGRAVRSGDELELGLANGTWLRGRYEWNGSAVVWPTLRVLLSGRVSETSERKLTAAVVLPPTASLRWPAESP